MTMGQTKKTPGAHMAAEIAEAGGVFARAAVQTVAAPDLSGLRALYTVARGSSAAAANSHLRMSSCSTTAVP